MPKRPQKKIVGARLARLMDARGVHDAKLARAIDVSPSQIKRWKHDETGAMPDAVRALADYFDVSEAFLYGIDDVREQLALEVTRALGSSEGEIVRAFGALSEEDRAKLAERVLGWVEALVTVPLAERKSPFSVMRRDDDAVAGTVAGSPAHTDGARSEEAPSVHARTRPGKP